MHCLVFNAMGLITRNNVHAHLCQFPQVIAHSKSRVQEDRGGLGQVSSTIHCTHNGSSHSNALRQFEMYY